MCKKSRFPCFYSLYIPFSYIYNYIIYFFKSCFILFYFILFYFILFYSILFYSILFYSILFYSILFYSILFYSTSIHFTLLHPPSLPPLFYFLSHLISFPFPSPSLPSSLVILFHSFSSVQTSFRLLTINLK